MNRNRVAIGATVLVVAIAIAWALLGEDGTRFVSPPSPERMPDAPLVENQRPSVLDVPVHIDVSLLLEEVEAHVPTQWVEESVQVGDDGTRASMAFTRGPFAASIRGDVATISATVAYALRSSFGVPLLPDIGVSCGTDRDRPAPRMAVRLEAPLGVAEDWTLRSETRVQSVTPATDSERDRCQVTLLGIDITQRVADGMSSFLNEHAATIDSLVSTVDLTPRLERWWRILSEPIGLDADTWLDLRPEAIAQGDIDGSGDVVEVMARLTARPTVVFGAPPEAELRPLPALGASGGDRRFAATVDVLSDYSEVSDVLTGEFLGVDFVGAGQRIVIDRITVSGIGQNEVAVEVAISGDVAGTLYFVGTPDFGGHDGFVRLPDLSLAVTTSDLLVAGASWLLDAGIEGLLRERAQWPVEGGVSWAAGRLDAGLNATLADGLRLRGAVGSLEVIDVLARSEGLLVRARTTGQVELLVEGR